MASVDALVLRAYVYGTAFWYALRGFCRVYDPSMVVGWFRPPSQSTLLPNDLEVYNVKTDGWCLITLALVLLSLVPTALPRSSSSTTSSASPTFLTLTKYIVAATVFHHVTTGLGAYEHYKRETHYNTSMAIGVWGNVWLTLTGLVTLGVLVLGSGAGGAKKKA